MMKNVKKILLLSTLLIVCSGFVMEVHAQKKRAQTTMKFLSTSTSARAAALSDAVTGVEMGALSMFYNPAGMARFEGTFDATFNYVGFIADINYSAAGIVYRPKNGRYGVFGLNFVTVDYGDLQETVLDFTADRGYRDVGTFSPSAFAAGIGYGLVVTEQFSVGGNLRYANLMLANAATSLSDDGGYNRTRYEESTFVVDFGVLFKTGLESLNFAMSIRNYSPEIRFQDENQELPLTFRIGLAMNVFDLTNINPNYHKLNLSIDANRPRDFDEQILIGAEYLFLDKLALRSGYVFPSDEQGASFGVGFVQPFGATKGLRVDYSYTAFGIFNSVSRFSAQITF